MDDAIAALEDLMRRAPSGQVEAADFYAALADVELLVLVTEESTPEDLNLPVLDRDGVGVIPVFTSEARMAEFGVHDRNYLLIHGRDLTDIWPEGHAAALNPGTEGQAMDVPDEVIQRLGEYSAYERRASPAPAGDDTGALGVGGLTVAATDDVTAAVDQAVAGLVAVDGVRLYTVQDIGASPETAVVLRFAAGHDPATELAPAMAAVLQAVRTVEPAAQLMDTAAVEEARMLLPEFAKPQL